METVLRNDVEKMAFEITGDMSLVEGMRRHEEETRLVWTLMWMRNAKGLNMRQLAQKMGVSASKVCRMEDGGDDDLKFGDIRAYAKALDMDISIMFDSPKDPAAHRIKQHVLATHTLLEKLCDISKEVGGGDEMSRKIREFYGDVLFNFLLMFEKSYSRLPQCEPLQFPAHDTIPVSKPEGVVATSV